MLEFSRTLYGKWSKMVDFLAFFLPRAKKEGGKDDSSSTSLFSEMEKM